MADGGESAVTDIIIFTLRVDDVWQQDELKA